MKRTLLTIGAIAVAGSLIGACASEDKTGGGDIPAATPTQTTYREASWSITVPAGWTSQDWTEKSDAKKAIRYAAADGSYFIVAIDPIGSGYDGDAVWRFVPKGPTGFEVAEKTPCDGEGCSNKDQRWDGYAFSKDTAEPDKIAGHVWYFVFGNDKTTTVNEAIFEEILESVEAKAA